MNENWTKWITASINKYFKENIEEELVEVEVVLINGDKANAINKVEIRLGGPEYDQQGKTNWLVTFDLDLLITIQPVNNIYASEVISGKLAKMFSAIPILTLGDEDKVLGCAQLIGKIRTIPWGKPNPKESIQQTSIEGSFELQLEDN